MSEDLTRRVFDLVARELGVPRSRLQSETRIEDDLGCTGDDAVDLMRAFSEEFEVDLNAFRFDLHFAPERPAGPEFLFLLPLSLLARVVGIRWPVPRSSPEPITVGHLVSVAARGCWFRPAADPSVAADAGPELP
jgi:hypothetical protein